MNKYIIIKTVLMIAFLVLLFPNFGVLHQESTIDNKTIPNSIIAEVSDSPSINVVYTDIFKERLKTAIENYFAKEISKNNIIGAAVGIVECDSIVYVGGFGKRNSQQDATINAETVFRIGSVSKGFAGILAGIEVQEGKLNWNAKVADYIPSFQLANAQKTKEVTLSHILSHTAGIPYHSYTNLIEDGVDLETIAADFKDVESIGPLGEVYSYQNAAFALGGVMIEKATGRSYTEEIQRKIFTPLNMLSASTDYQTFIKNENIAHPHYRRYGRYNPTKINRKYYNAIAAGGVNASVTDMSKYMKFLLGNNPEILSSSTMSQVFNPMIEIEGRSKYYQRWEGHQKSGYGYGWRIHTFKDKTTGTLKKMIHHGGHVNSYRSEIAIYPEEDLGITVLFNSPTKLAKRVIPELRQIVKEVLELPLPQENFVEGLAFHYNSNNYSFNINAPFLSVR